jgi:hypothetical protein
LRKSYVSRQHSPNPPVVRVIQSWPQVHWIHAKKAHEPQPEITVVVTVHDDGHVELDGDDLHLSLWSHDPAWLQSVLGHAGHHGLWKPRFHVLFVPRYGGRIVNLAALDHLTPCVADDDHSPAIRQRPPWSAPRQARCWRGR